VSRPVFSGPVGGLCGPSIFVKPRNTQLIRLLLLKLGSIPVIPFSRSESNFEEGLISFKRFDVSPF
jgi:hypothetical protein